MTTTARSDYVTVHHAAELLGLPVAYARNLADRLPGKNVANGERLLSRRGIEAYVARQGGWAVWREMVAAERKGERARMKRERIRASIVTAKVVEGAARATADRARAAETVDPRRRELEARVEREMASSPKFAVKLRESGRWPIKPRMADAKALTELKAASSSAVRIARVQADTTTGARLNPLPPRVNAIRKAMRDERRRGYFNATAEWWSAPGGRDGFTVTGHAVVFGAWSEELQTRRGSFRERIAPGAFKDVLAARPDVRLLWNHDDNYVMARTKAGTLQLREDTVGLSIRATVAASGFADRLRASMERGDVDQMSFAFADATDDWRENPGTGGIERTITSIGKLFDVSVCTYPAYPSSKVAVAAVA